MHRGCELPVEFAEPLRAQPLYFAQCNRCVVQQASNVYTLTMWREGRQITRPPGEHVHRAVVIQTAKVMEGDTDLQDALIQLAHLTGFGTPEKFQRFVLLEVLTAVELVDPFQQLRGRRLVAPGHAALS